MGDSKHHGELAPGVRLTGAGIRYYRGANFQSLTQALKEARGFNDHSKWWIGELIDKIEREYGEYVWQALDEAGFGNQYQLNNYRRVFQAFPNVEDRFPLSWSHHLILSAKHYSREEKNQWLERAVQEKLSVAELQQLLPSRPKKRTKEPAKCPHCGGEL